METIETLNEKTVDGLKKLIKMNLDASKGYEEAAKRVEHEPLADAFRIYSQQRESYVRELSAVLGVNEEEAPEDGTALGSVHQWWLSFRDAINGGSVDVVLAEAIRGEDSLIDKYGDVLIDSAGSPLNATLHNQLSDIRAARDRLQSIKDSSA